MRIFIRAGLLLTMAVIFAGTTDAEARVVNYSGDCSSGGSWTMSITIDDNTGKVIRREGTNCNGEHWVDHCGAKTDTLSTTDDRAIQDAMTTPPWLIRLHTDEA